ncbi:hypothetical protein [Arthrobacter sp. Leaf337]|uniref:hypothetical protein n=1 Tax=Arthrobacter sp. Leaf337 TaxID=1736342 RepID=UPI000A57F465|nr:hypothetical protein [Arthrobacter sp. Leaf337]
MNAAHTFDIESLGERQLAEKSLVRTVQYWRLVNGANLQPAEEQDWNTILKNAYGDPKTHLVLNKVVSGKVFTLQPEDDWDEFLRPSSMNGLKQVDDGTVYALVASTDKDHLPSQAKRGTGEQKAVTVDKGYTPVDNLFIWFLPFGNIMAVLQESVSSARPKAIATWLTHIMRAQGNLPQHNFQWTAEPVVDPDKKRFLDNAKRLRRIEIGGTVKQSVNGPLRDLLMGPTYEGTYEIELKVRHVKKNNRQSYASDTRDMMDWFEETFGGHLGELDKAKVVVDRDPGDHIPQGEIDLISQRITRKRSIEVGKRGQAILASSAVSEIVKAYIQDFDELAKLR